MSLADELNRLQACVVSSEHAGPVPAAVVKAGIQMSERQGGGEVVVTFRRSGKPAWKEDHVEATTAKIVAPKKVFGI